MLNVLVFHRCVPLFEQKNKEYREKHSMKAKLDAQRRVVWGHFIDTVQQKSSDIVARNRFCDVIRGHVEENVKQQIPDLIYKTIIETFQMSKHELCIEILEDLAVKEQFNSYVLYISDPYTYASRWISDYIDRKCFADGLYYEFADMETNRIVTIISDTVRKVGNENLNEWLKIFEKEIENKLPISSDSFSLVREQTVSDMEDFRNKLIQELKNISEEIKDKFSKDCFFSNMAKPHSIRKIIEKLWGCKCVCPFCKEPCQWNTNHSRSHSCIQHRPVGLIGSSWKTNGALNIESCSFFVQTNTGFNCGRGIALCERESGKCKKNWENRRVSSIQGIQNIRPRLEHSSLP
ncbi:interferon-induced very large GTPase 1-like [Argopecten irradians]|uniref:interferon-induced very large GTPase 1-like n=1 Tax=Argopecten irradians TaxID=31199 RepID=UPI00371426A8